MMLRTWILLIGMATATAGCFTPVPNFGRLVIPDYPIRLRDMRFPSGLRIVVEEDRRMPLVAITTVVGAGSTSDPVGKEGVAHYLEHLAFSSRPSGHASFARMLEAAGASEYEASTEFDATSFIVLTPKEAFPDVLRLEAMRLASPVRGVTDEVMSLERDVVIRELELGNEMGHIGEALHRMQQALFPRGHPYSRPMGGTRQSLASLTLEDVQAFVRQHYRPENMTMVIVGDVDLETVDRIIQSRFPGELLEPSGAVAAGPRLSREASEPPSLPSKPMARYDAAIDAPEVWIGWTLPRSFDADSFILNYASQAISRSALKAAILKHPDIRSVDTDLIRGKETSLLLCKVRLHEGRDVERAVEPILDDLMDHWGVKEDREVEEGEMVRKQRLTLTGTMLGAEGVLVRSILRAQTTHFSGDPRTYSRLQKSLAQTDPTRFSRFAYQYLNRQRAQFLHLVPLPPSAMPAPRMTGIGLELRREEAPVNSAAHRAVFQTTGLGSYRTVRLKNGIELIIGARPGFPTVTVGATLFGGSALAQPRGTADVADWTTFARSTFNGHARDMGIHQYSFVGNDSTRHVLRGSSGNMINMLAILEESLRTQKTEETTVNYLQRELLPPRKKSEERPEARGARAFLAQLLPLHPHGRGIVTDDLAKVTKADVDRWVAETYRADNLVVAVVGDVAESAVKELAAEWLAGETSLPRGRWWQPPPPPKVPAGTRWSVTEVPQATRNHLMLGCVLPPRSGPQASALYDITARLLGKQVRQLLRERLQALYSVDAVVSRHQGGTITLQLRGTFDAANFWTALEGVRDAFADLASAGPQPTELKWVQWRLATQLFGNFETSDDQVSLILAARDLGEPPDFYASYLARLPEVSASEVKNVVDECTRSGLVLHAVGDLSAVEPALKATWPVGTFVVP